MLIKMEAWEVTDSPNMNRSGGLEGAKYGLFHWAPTTVGKLPGLVKIILTMNTMTFFSA